MDETTDFAYTRVTAAAQNTKTVYSLSRTIPRGGFMYIYLSNESTDNMEVYFDELEITHTKGKILQEDHYYPFGMNISALSSTAPLAKPNRYKFNGNEEQLDFDWNIYDFNFRMYDAQLGRFSSIDPMAEVDHQLAWTPYHFSYNNPVNLSDPTGLDALDWSWSFDGGADTYNAAAAYGDWARAREENEKTVDDWVNRVNGYHVTIDSETGESTIRRSEVTKKERTSRRAYLTVDSKVYKVDAEGNITEVTVGQTEMVLVYSWGEVRYDKDASQQLSRETVNMSDPSFSSYADELVDTFSQFMKSNDISDIKRGEIPYFGFSNRAENFFAILIPKIVSGYTKNKWLGTGTGVLINESRKGQMIRLVKISLDEAEEAVERFKKRSN